MVTILKDINPIDETDNYDVIMLGTTIYGEMTQGFQKEMADKYPNVNEANMHQPYGDLRRLGTRLTVREKDKPIITLLYICCKEGRKKYTLQMQHLIHALQTANNEFKGKRVLSPIIGTSPWDGGSNREEMIKLMEHYTPDLNLFLFDNQKITAKNSKNGKNA